MTDKKKPVDNPTMIRIDGDVKDANISGNTRFGKGSILEANGRVERLKAIGNTSFSNDSEQNQDGNSSADDPWYKKPIGIVGLSVAGALITAAAIVALKHYF